MFSSQKQDKAGKIGAANKKAVVAGKSYAEIGRESSGEAESPMQFGILPRAFEDTVADLVADYQRRSKDTAEITDKATSDKITFQLVASIDM